VETSSIKYEFIVSIVETSSITYKFIVHNFFIVHLNLRSYIFYTINNFFTQYNRSKLASHKKTLVKSIQENEKIPRNFG